MQSPTARDLALCSNENTFFAKLETSMAAGAKRMLQSSGNS